MQFTDSNGIEKTIQLMSYTEEVCETISKVIIENKLNGRPLVITGFLCVGMGQTLTHKSLGSFTSAIFGHIDIDNDRIYQLFGRITGRMKDWGDKYIQTQVYCPTIIMDRCRVVEECAKKMAYEHNGKMVTREDYREPMNGNESVIGNIPKSKRDSKQPSIDDPSKTVPIVFSIEDCEYESIRRVKGNGWDYSTIYPIIQKYKPDIISELDRIEKAGGKDQIVQPREIKSDTYSEYITKFVNAFNKKEPCKHIGNIKDPIDTFQIYLDKIEHRIIVSIIYGSKK
jgi:hypothetical protein